MVIIMPDQPKGLEFLKGDWELNKDSPFEDNIFDLATQGLKENGRSTIIVTMPTFKIDSNISVGKYLKKLGVKAAFQDGDFDEIIPNEPLRYKKQNVHLYLLDL